MPWDLAGNSGIKPTTNFLGTRDSQPLAIRTNNTEKVRVTPTGNVGIGTTNPMYGRLMIEDGAVPLSLRETGQSVTAGGLWRMPLDAGMLRFDVNTAAAGDFSPGGYLTPLTMFPTGDVGIHRNLAVGGDLLFKANPIAAEDPGDIIFQSAGGSQKARIWSNPGAGPGLHLSSTGNRPNLTLTGDGTILLGNNLALESGLQLYGRGRLHVHGEEILYILNKAGAVIGKEWGGNGNLSVQGNVTVGGDIMLSGADCAEDFDVASTGGEIEPGTVMVIDEEGALKPSEQSYDKRVAGVVSGAGDYKSGIVLDKQAARMDRKAVALMGKVWCKIDARHSPIGVGDLLTTSPTPGHAMKADDPVRASGAIIGKTLQGLTGGLGLLPILVSLQ